MKYLKFSISNMYTCHLFLGLFYITIFTYFTEDVFVGTQSTCDTRVEFINTRLIFNTENGITTSFIISYSTRIFPTTFSNTFIWIKSLTLFFFHIDPLSLGFKAVTSWQYVYQSIYLVSYV